MEAEWKGVSDKFVSIGGLWRIARDEEVSDEYLACVIRWTMTYWPKREELRKGSTSFRTRFTEIQQDYARHMEEMGSSNKPSSGRRADDEDSDDDDAFTTKGFEDASATVVPFPFDEEL